MNNLEFNNLTPNLQISFYYRLKEIKTTYFVESLSRTIQTLNIPLIDHELAKFVPEESLKKLAAFGLRAEILFPIPIILRSNPYLLGYYRFLFGFSQKEFYLARAFSKFKSLETRGQISPKLDGSIDELCKELIRIATQLLEGIDHWSLDVVKELQLLTLGPQLRGGQNTRLGQDATRLFFNLIHEYVKSNIKESSDHSIIIENDSKRMVLIEFFSDPDVKITEVVNDKYNRKIVSIEIKGGTDYSNIHNRLGEAEKSHQNARMNGFFEFWTIIRVSIDLEIAKRESPTTSHFYNLDKIINKSTDESRQFREHLCSILGIKI